MAPEQEEQRNLHGDGHDGP